MADEAKKDILSEQLPTIQVEDKSVKILKKASPLWLSVSETGKICGVNNKTIRRAIQAKTVKYKVVNNRYYIEFGSTVAYLNETRKLKNKLDFLGVGQYVDKWRK